MNSTLIIEKELNIEIKNIYQTINSKKEQFYIVLTKTVFIV